jgi:hydroxyacylglutathione hydrolase
MTTTLALHILPAGPIGTNAYLLTEPTLGEAVLIDAPGGVWADVQPILREEKCRLKELWITHGHWDHTQGAAEIIRATQAKVRAHADDRVLIETPDVMKRFMDQDLRLEPVKVDAWVTQGDKLAAFGATVEVRHVPGHCPGNVLFYFMPSMTQPTKEGMSSVASAKEDADSNWLAMGAAFVGDAIFAGSVGRTDLPGGDFALLENSIRAQIYTLPDATVLFPGHGPATTVEEEKASNPYVAG